MRGVQAHLVLEAGGGEASLLSLRAVLGVMGKRIRPTPGLRNENRGGGGEACCECLRQFGHVVDLFGTTGIAHARSFLVLTSI
jgi:hypothetical protein